MIDEHALDSTMLHFKAELNRKGYQESSINRYLKHNDAFLSFINKKPHYVRKEDIELYLKFLASDNNLRKKLVIEIYEALELFYDSILKRGFCIESPYEEEVEELLLEKEDIKKMIDATPSIKHKLFIKLLYSTGMKMSEAVKLKIDDINLEEKSIKIKRGKKEIDFPLADSIIPDIGHYLDTRKDSNPFLFDNGDDHISPKTGQTYLDIASKQAGILRVFYPTLQKSFAKHLAEAGGVQASIYYKMANAKLTTNSDYLKKAFALIKDKEHPLDSI